MANCWQEATSLAERPQVPLVDNNFVEVRSLTNSEGDPGRVVGSDDEENSDSSDEETDSADDEEEDTSCGSEEESSADEDENEDENEEDESEDESESEDELETIKSSQITFCEDSGDGALLPAVPDHLKEVIVAKCKEKKKKCPKQKKKKCKDECCKLRKKPKKKEKDAFTLASCGQDPSCAINSALKCIENMATCSDPCKKMKYLGQAMAKINGANEACWLGETMQTVNEAKCKSCECQKKKNKTSSKKKKKKCKKKKKKKCCLVSI